jgi:hypothetical protein
MTHEPTPNALADAKRTLEREIHEAIRRYEVATGTVVTAIRRHIPPHDPTSQRYDAPRVIVTAEVA